MHVENFFNRLAAEINGADENPSILLLSKFNIPLECSLATFLV